MVTVILRQTHLNSQQQSNKNSSKYMQDSDDISRPYVPITGCDMQDFISQTVTGRQSHNSSFVDDNHSKIAHTKHLKDIQTV